MTSRTQLRGNCQCCGREHAATNGRIAKHGYEVTDGYFRGVCSGHQFEPLQYTRDIADQIVKSCRVDAVELDTKVTALKDGSEKPKFVQGSWDSKTREYAKVPFDQGTDYQQRHAIDSEIFRVEQRARMARSFADQLEGLANKVHGQPLREVTVTAPEPIQYGEKRKRSDNLVLECTNVLRGSVRYKFTSEHGKTLLGRMGVQSWRKLPVAE